MQYFVITTIILSLFLILCLVLIIYLFKKKLRLKKLHNKPDPKKYTYKNLTQQVALDSLLWKEELNKVLMILKDNKVTHIFLMHGTFIGNDPFEFIVFFEKILPNISPSIFNKLKLLTRYHQSKFIGDTGNFDKEYIKILKESFSKYIKVHEYHWSGANNHLARLLCAKDFIIFIFKNIQDSHKGHVLLLGHSHAGQVFALMTQLLNKKYSNQLLTKILQKDLPPSDEFDSIINSIKKEKMNMITFGAPTRYQFIESKNINVLHIINHRGNSPMAGDLKKLLFTSDGDYIQQLGIEGSDTLSPIKEHRLINGQLDEVLGVGVNLKVWIKNIKNKKRVHESGHTYLVDYEDHSKIPNCFKTLFGHGVYTNKDKILFNFELIIDFFYVKR